MERLWINTATPWRDMRKQLAVRCFTNMVKIYIQTIFSVRGETVDALVDENSQTVVDGSVDDFWCFKSKVKETSQHMDVYPIYPIIEYNNRLYTLWNKVPPVPFLFSVFEP